jgi:hypothetical protein
MNLPRILPRFLKFASFAPERKSNVQAWDVRAKNAPQILPLFSLALLANGVRIAPRVIYNAGSNWLILFGIDEVLKR